MSNYTVPPPHRGTIVQDPEDQFRALHQNGGAFFVP